MEELYRVRRKINIDNYTFKDYAIYFEKFDKRVLCIVLQDETLEILVDKYQLPHLIGLQYAYDKTNNIKSFKGKKGVEKLLNNDINVKIFKERITKNKPFAGTKRITWTMIQDRIEWLPYFFNNISKKTRLRQNKPNRIVDSSLKGNYFYFKVENHKYLILSLLKTRKKYTLESFIVYDSIDFLIDLKELSILDIYWKS